MISKRKMYKQIHDDRCKFYIKEGMKTIAGVMPDDKIIEKEYRKYKNKITIPFLDIRITDACTLKCKHCTEWNPYLLSNRVLKKLTESVDYIFGISLIGGEPLVNADIDKILEYCINDNKIGYILITTNGTLMPNRSTLEKLKSKKVKTILSRYDQRKKDNYLELLDFLIENNCNYFVYDCSQRFIDLGMPRGIQKESAAITYDKYIDCWLRHCAHFAEGKIYRCPRTYAGVKMKLFKEEDVQDEIIDIYEFHSKREWKTIFKQFYSLPYLNSCTACNPKSKRKSYKAAIQVDER